jgi:4-amino-4-deoxy-L-arabinose transferase-like glycosyltransferase
MRLLSPTHDETTHLPSGFTYLKTGQFRLNPEHPPLVKIVSALPLLALHPKVNFDDPAWQAEPPDQWRFGYGFLFTNDADRLLFWGRMPIVLLGTLLGVYVFLWARDLFGPAAGLLALFLYSFCPNVIAHSHLVTMDLPLSSFCVMTFYHGWKYARQRKNAHLIATGLGLGLALGTKFTAVILAPVLLLLLLLSALLPSVSGPGAGKRLARSAIDSAVVLAIAATTVWAIYFFPSDPLFYWKGLREVYGSHDTAFEYYLMGAFSQEGWWYYFLIAFLVKTPLPTLFALALSLVLLRRLSARHWIDEVFVALPAVAVFAVTSWLAHNIGLRYVLPVYPLLFVFVSRLAGLLSLRRSFAFLGALLGTWYLGTAVWIYPDHLAYFNEAVGGPERGYEYLDDSNIDWGQDLKRVKPWLDRNGFEKVFLSTAFNTSPAYYGIRWERVIETDLFQKPRPGVYVMSVHILVRVRLLGLRNNTHSDWLSDHQPIGRVGYSFLVYRFE